MYCVPARLAPPGVRHCGHPREEENEHISSAYHIPNPMSKGVCGHRIDLDSCFQSLGFFSSGHQTGRQLTTELVGCLHDILWKKAARSFEVWE